jgi:hypothetical protein
LQAAGCTARWLATRKPNGPAAEFKSVDCVDEALPSTTERQTWHGCALISRCGLQQLRGNLDERTCAHRVSTGTHNLVRNSLSSATIYGKDGRMFCLRGVIASRAAVRISYEALASRVKHVCGQRSPQTCLDNHLRRRVAQITLEFELRQHTSGLLCCGRHMAPLRLPVGDRT